VKVNGCTAFVTGANRGLGKAFTKGLLQAGARRVYAAARDPERLKALVESDPARIVPVHVDITVEDHIKAAAARCPDVNVLVNNAGIVRDVGIITAPDLDDARAQMEVNFWGPVRMCRAFAPVLRKNGGGSIINVLSNLALVHLPFQGFYCASKAAAWSMTHGVRAQLRSQGTLVIAVLPDAIDTEMVAAIDCPKVAPESVVEAALRAIEEGREDLFGPEVGDPMGWSKRFYTDPKAVEREGAGLDALQPGS
jgi:NAD(P)-dependent dehydrogenase (short-subunit alcohol dehydrogenase family)